MDPAARTSTPPLVTTPAPGGPETTKRRVRNYLLDTSLQLKLASYLVVVAMVLSFVLGWLLWSAWRETSRVVALSVPEAAEALAPALAEADRGRIVGVAVALGLVLLCLLVASVVVTHRIAGPAFAIGQTCREVAAGRLAAPRKLRERDLLQDLAGEVAIMVDALRARELGERAAISRAVARLRDPIAPQPERDAALAELERLASDKDVRLGS
jgi:HAMP domain-containing protein